MANMAKSGLSDQQESWFLSVLDLKFQQQEAVIRKLLVSVSRPHTGQPFRERRTDLSLLEPLEMDMVQEAPKFSPEIAILESTDDTAGHPTVPSPVSSPSSPAGGKRSRTLARVMNENLQGSDPPFKAFIKGSLDAYMGIVVVARLQNY